MSHTHEEVIKCAIEEFKRMDDLIASLSEGGREKLLPRPET